MKDSEFIELLNLYLDHEITPADAARLEAEVLGNAKRREIYRDYCRMQKGCKLLAQEFVAESATAGDGKVVAFEPVRASARRTNTYIAGGFAAAAACVAFVFIASNRPTHVTPAAAEQTLTQASVSAPADGLAGMPARSTERRIGRTVTVPVAREVQPTFANALTLSSSPATTASLLSAPDQGAAQFEWINSMQLAPVQRVSIDEFRFDGRSPLRTNNQPFAVPGASPGQLEWNAIRYRK